MEVKGYKVFNPDWTCRNKQYTCPGIFEEDVIPSVCREGMHFCKKAADCFNYYNFDPQNRVAEVIARGSVAENGDKCCTNELEIVREVPWAELLELVNTGRCCTGYQNSGYRNSGNRNSGDQNSGDRNSGDWNSGDQNSGDWNKTNHSAGVFNTKEQPITMFNLPSKWNYSDWAQSEACMILNKIPHDPVVWIWEEEMTEEEKLYHPEHETVGGYLKEMDLSDNAKIWWRGLTNKEKETIMSLPNFDAQIFKEITGVDVNL